MNQVNQINNSAADIELLKNVPVAFWYFQFNEKKLVWSKELYELFHIENDQSASFEKLNGFIQPQFLAAWQNYFKSLFNGDNIASIEIKATVNSSEKILSLSSSVMSNEKSEKLLTGVIQDITARRMQEEELIKNEEKLYKFSQLATEGCIILDKAEIVDVNPAFEKISDYSKEELLGKSAAALLTKDSIKIMAENLSSNYTFPYELVLVQKSGKQIPIEVQGYFFEYRGKTLRFTSVRDISKLKEKEKQGTNLSVLVELSKSKNVISGAFMEATADILQKICETLLVSRASIWQYNKNGKYIRRLGLFEKKQKAYDPERLVFKSEPFKSCLDILIKDGVLSIQDVQEDPITKNISSSAFWPSDIKSLLQIPIIIDGELRAILHIENENDIKSWGSQDILFVKSAVDIMIITYKSFQRQRAENKIKQKNIILNHQKEIIEEKNKEVMDSIHYAKRIQRAMITSDTYFNKYLNEHFIFYQPKDIVSGDFYWALETGNKFFLIVADCTGHGVPGAFMSLINIASLNEVIVEKKITSPELILNEVRLNIIKALNPEGNEEGKDGMDCILCCFDFDTMTLEYAAANNAFYLVRNKELIICQADKMPVGKGENEESFTLRKLKLQEGDSLYLLTDGYADQFGGPKGKKYKYRQLEELLVSINDEPLESQQQIVEKSFNTWKDNLEQVDDVLLIGIKI
ncbi:MAG: SpoIIE family protein phosphatase [Bacteroidia bacterium]